MQHPLSVEVVNEYGEQAVRISIDGAAVVLGTMDVDAIIRHLSYIRAGMRPEVHQTPSRAQQYVLEMDPSWHSEKHPLYDGAVLMFRHTGLGWAAFALPVPSLQKLSETLIQHLAVLEEEHCMPN